MERNYHRLYRDAHVIEPWPTSPVTPDGDDAEDAYPASVDARRLVRALWDAAKRVKTHPQHDA